MTIARYLIQFLVWGLIGLGLAAGVFLGRLSTGPVVLDWIKPRIEAALKPGHAEVNVAIGRTELRLSKNHRTIELIGIDVRYLDQDRKTFLTFPEVEVTLSVEAFLEHGMIAASHVDARAPSLRLARADDGSIGLYSDDADREDIASDVDFVAFLKHFVLAPESDDRIAYLKRLHIRGGHLAYSDSKQRGTIDAEAADLVLVRQDEGVSGWLRADLVQKEKRTSVQFLGLADTDTEDIKLDVTIEDLIPADLIDLLQTVLPWLPKEIGQIDTPVQASIKGALGFDGTLSPLEIDMQMVDGMLDLPEYLAGPMPITLSELQGTMAADFNGFDIDHFRLIGFDAELKAKGQVSWRHGERSVDLDLEASHISAEHLPIFWPLSLGQDGRTWVVENIKTGLVSSAEAKLSLVEEDFSPAPLRDDAIQGMFNFEDLSVRYIDTMPPLEKAVGTATFDADRLHFDVTGGNNAGVELTGGTVTITGVGKPGRDTTQLQVLADAQGPVDQALVLLDHPPLDVAKDLEIAPEQTSGDVISRIDVRMPLHDDVTEEEVTVVAEAELGNVAISGLPRLGDDVLLRVGDFQLSVGEEAIKLNGTATIADLPLNIDIEEPLIEGTAKRRILLTGEVSPSTLEDLGWTMSGVDGALAFNATLTETSDNIWIDLDADLTDLVIEPPGLTWRKAAGDDGKLIASIAVPNEDPIEVKQFELTANGLLATGSLILSQPDYEIETLSLDEIQLGNSQGSLRMEGDQDKGQKMTVEAALLDLDRLLDDEDDQEAELDLDLDKFQVAMRADRLIYKGLELRDVQADAAHRDDKWRTASFLGSLASGGKVAWELEPEGEGDHQRLDIRSDDAGALIQALDLGQRVQGGEFHLAATVSSQDPLVATGRLEIDRFTLANAPLLARLLTVASLTGIGNLLGGEGIQVDHLILPFSMQDQKLNLADGLLRGSQLGLTTKGTIDLEAKAINLAGTVIPVYSINRLIGQVPIIGRILTGTDGRGAFAATYRIQGPHSRPTVYVNPLSMLAPGLLRDIFGGLVNGAPVPSE